MHVGPGFASGFAAACEPVDPAAVVSPSSIGFGINCGVAPFCAELAQALFDHVSVGVGSKDVVPMSAADLDEALKFGLDWPGRIRVHAPGGLAAR